MKDVSLVLPNIGFVSIIGKSGSGKSTLLNVLATIDSPTEGEIFFLNKDLAKAKEKEKSVYRNHCVSVVFQHYNLLEDDDVYFNIALPLIIRGESNSSIQDEVAKLLKKLNISSLSTRKVNTLSGGEKQRVAIARSLITNPKVVLCDEPTGALDKNNSRNVMEILKIISKEKLVIVVSHNSVLVKEYSDEIITLKDGKVINDTIYKRNDRSIEKPRGHLSNKYVKVFTKRNFKRYLKRNIVSLLACSFAFSIAFLTLGFKFSSPEKLEEITRNYLDSNVFSISEKKVYEISNSPLSISKIIRPDIDKLSFLEDTITSLEIVEDLSYLFSPLTDIKYKGEIVNNVSFLPIDTFLKKDILYQNDISEDSLNMTYINLELADKLVHNGDYASLIGDSITLSIIKEINCVTNDESKPLISDYFVYEKEITIEGVAREFSFLNTPKFYYSYPLAQEYLDEIVMPNYSAYKNEDVTWLTYIRSAGNDDIVSNYSLLAFVSDYDEVPKIKLLRDALISEESVYEISSNSLLISDTFLSISSLISIVLTVFIVIAALGASFIIGVFAFASILEKQKEMAILTSLGASKSSLKSIFTTEKFYVGLLSSFLSIGLAFLFSSIINLIINATLHVDSFITLPIVSYRGVFFFFPIIMTLVILVLSYISTSIPYYYYTKQSIVKELRDE